jgi:hypothetical protein
MDVGRFFQLRARPLRNGRRFVAQQFFDVQHLGHFDAAAARHDAGRNVGLEDRVAGRLRRLARALAVDGRQWVAAAAHRLQRAPLPLVGLCTDAPRALTRPDRREGDQQDDRSDQ